MKTLYITCLFLICSLAQVVAQNTCNHESAVYSTNNSTITFISVKYNFPSQGKSTWFYTINNSNGKKGISHTSFQVSNCINKGDFNGGGTYTSQDANGLHYSNMFSIGNDPSNQSNPYVIKYDVEVTSRSVVNVFFVLNQNYVIGSNLVYIKPGTTFESDSICGPSLSCEAVPVKLINFKASLQENNPLLQWSTASEKNNQGFYIEQSDDAKHFKEIGFVSSNGNSQSVKNYTFIDYSNTWGYYRLRIVDFDGYTEYSPVDFIENPFFTSKRISVNPTISESIIHISSTYNLAKEASIYNSFGTKVLSINLSIENNKMVDLNISTLTKGVYFIVIDDQPAVKFIRQ